IRYIVYLPKTIELSSVLVLDVITLVHLRLAHSKVTTIQANTISASARAVEIRLFKQAFSQSIPLLVTFVCFAVINPQLSDGFAKFLTTTFVWHLAHGFDGLIIDLFHTRLNLFRKRKENSRSIAASSSHSPTTII
ncbi:hypothetical protein PENTCL1PPCAC_16736, partial [Pristionchus entomophagus]